MKRTTTPRFWPIERKTKKYVITPAPGPHAKKRCIPLGILLRDMLHYAATARESRMILNQGLVRVDGKPRKSNNFPIGLMDVLSIGEENYRILPNAKGFYLQKIEESEARIKPERIMSKTTVRSGKTQLNLFDGHNIIVDKADYKTGDTIVMDASTRAIKQHIRMKDGAFAVIIDGKNAGKLGSIEQIAVVKMHTAQVTMNAGGEKIIVPKDYVYVIGDKEPVVKTGG